MNNIYNNKYAFLNNKPKGLFIIFILLCIILIILLIITIKVKTYDNYQTKGYISCNETCFITTVIPTNIDFKKIKLNNKDLDYEIESSAIEIDEENYISYIRLVLKTKEKLTNEEIVDLNFYYNKQRIIEKIKEKI